MKQINMNYIEWIWLSFSLLSVFLNFTHTKNNKKKHPKKNNTDVQYSRIQIGDTKTGFFNAENTIN